MSTSERPGLIQLTPAAARGELGVLEHEFNITVLNLLPLALLVVFTLKKVPPSSPSWARRSSPASWPASRSGLW
jgi:hypothetical protein